MQGCVDTAFRDATANVLAVWAVSSMAVPPRTSSGWCYGRPEVVMLVQTRAIW